MLVTFRDAIDNLVDYVGGETQSGSHRVFRRSVRQAFNTFYQVHPWRYYQSAINIGTSQATFSTQMKYVMSTRILSAEFTVLTATNTTPIRITVESGFEPLDGEEVTIRNAVGNTNANGTWTLSKVSETEYDLVGSVGNNVYDLASGQINRGVFPSWAGEASVRIGNSYWVIIKAIDDYNLELDELRNPKADTTGEFIVQRRHFDLPDDFHKMSVVSDGRYAFISDGYVSPEAWLATEQFGFYRTTYPFRWTILPHPITTGRYRLHFTGYPIDDGNVSFMYQRRKNDAFRWSGNETSASSVFNSSISTVADSPLVVGVGTSFKNSMVGSVLRVGGVVTSNHEEPESLDGLNPYEEEHIILSVESATQLTLETPAVSSGTGLQYIVSDLIDLAPEHFNAFYRCCEYHYAVTTKRDGSSLNNAQTAYQNALKLSMESDYKVSFYGAATGSDDSVAMFGDPLNTDFGTTVSTGP